MNWLQTLGGFVFWRENGGAENRAKGDTMAHSKRAWHSFGGAVESREEREGCEGERSFHSFTDFAFFARQFICSPV